MEKDHLKTPFEILEPSSIGVNEEREVHESSDEVTVLLDQVVRIAVSWGSKLSARSEDLEARQRNAEKSLADSRCQLDQIESRLENNESKMNALRDNQARISAQIQKLIDRLSTLTQNLDQTRIFSEAISRRIDKLANDFIEREVREPLFKDVLQLYESFDILNESMSSPKNISGGLTFHFKQFLDRYGLKIICPEVGSTFDPKKHQSIDQQEAPKKELEGQIAGIYHSGLYRDGKIIRPAQVAVFVSKSDDCNLDVIEGGHRNEEYDQE